MDINKIVQLPCSEHISADGFTEAKLRPKKDTDKRIQFDQYSCKCKNLWTLAAAYREACEDRDLWQKSEGECNLAYAELSAKYDRLMKAALVMYNDLDLHWPNSDGIDMMEELL